MRATVNSLLPQLSLHVYCTLLFVTPWPLPTAFMVSIITQILPRLVVSSSSTAAIKSDLIRALDHEDEADLTVAQLRRAGVEVRDDKEVWESRLEPSHSSGTAVTMQGLVSEQVLVAWF
eukprot:SAG22_NODE_13657_length_399_cov_0.690000_1_plen_118_part_10